MSRLSELVELYSAQAENEIKQTRIDVLMFEYCEYEMTAEQIRRYGLAQHKVKWLDVPAFLRKIATKINH